MNIVSTNKLGKSSTATKTVVVNRGEEEPVRRSVDKPMRIGGVQVKLIIGPNAAWVEVSTDGQKKFDGLLGAGVTQTFEGLSEVRVFSGNAGSTRVSLNGEKDQILGKDGEVLEKVYRNEDQEQGEATPSTTP